MRSLPRGECAFQIASTQFREVTLPLRCRFGSYRFRLRRRQPNLPLGPHQAPILCHKRLSTASRCSLEGASQAWPLPPWHRHSAERLIRMRKPGAATARTFCLTEEEICHFQSTQSRQFPNLAAAVPHQHGHAEKAGFKIDRVIADNGVSGISTALAERPEGRRLHDVLRASDTLVVR